MEFLIFKKKKNFQFFFQFFFSKKFKTATCHFIIVPRGSLQS